MQCNILVTGTPGTGKSTICQLLALSLNLKHVVFSETVKQLNPVWDPILHTFDVTDEIEDKALDTLEPLMTEGGIILESHCPSIFPERWFDGVIVLRTDLKILSARLGARGYPEVKINENLQCETMDTIEIETKESYKEDRVLVLMNYPMSKLDSNVEEAIKFIEMLDVQDKTKPDEIASEESS